VVQNALPSCRRRRTPGPPAPWARTPLATTTGLGDRAPVDPGLAVPSVQEHVRVLGDLEREAAERANLLIEARIRDTSDLQIPDSMAESAEARSCSLALSTAADVRFQALCGRSDDLWWDLQCPAKDSGAVIV
jgi:hypothetical protein